MPKDSVTIFPQVCIIESPSAGDVHVGRNEGQALSRALTLADVRNNYYSVATPTELGACFRQMLSDAAIMQKNGVADFPMLYIHFSAHGNENGIGLTDGEFVGWSTLGDLLIAFARQAGRDFPECKACMQTLCFSVCKGLYGAKMAAGKEICPFVGMIGSHIDVGWSDSLTAFVTFYHNVCHKGVITVDGVRRMNAAIGSELFFPIVSSQIPGFKSDLGQ